MGESRSTIYPTQAKHTQNRRLRHLHGISLRNLNLTRPAARPRGKTITDDDYNLKTAAKSLRDENRKLHHTKSYDQLLKPEVQQSSSRVLVESDHVVAKPQRPGRGVLRRRSTLHWGTSNPRARQSKLEAVEANRLVNSWFSIHHEQHEQPIYISEVMERSMNPSFSFFDLDPSLATATRTDEFILCVWSKSDFMDDYRMLVELHVNLRSLQFVGRSLENFHHPLPENCVLLHLSDGIYTSFTDLPAAPAAQPTLTAAMKAMAPAQVTSFDALVKLANLDDVIQDALRARAEMEANINSMLPNMPAAENALTRLATQRELLRNLRRARETEQKNIDHLAREKSELSASLESRRVVLRGLPQERSYGQTNCQKLGTESQRAQKQLDVLGEGSGGQIRRICTSLLQVFPIEPIKNRALQFTIRNIYLPNSTFSDTNRDEIAAALGYTAQLVYRLSLYLSVPLPYSIEPHESSSYICDNISAGIAQRQFPLQPTGAAYKFEYGVFLLNKDIEFLMNRSGLRAMDIRHTLPNLKYLMFVLTAGSGDLPGRKAGGIRGLLRNKLSPSVSRRGSEESVTSLASTLMGDSGPGEIDQEKVGDTDDSFHPSLRPRAMPYRKSMLRDTG